MAHIQTVKKTIDATASATHSSGAVTFTAGNQAICIVMTYANGGVPPVVSSAVSSAGGSFTIDKTVADSDKRLTILSKVNMAAGSQTCDLTFATAATDYVTAFLMERSGGPLTSIVDGTGSTGSGVGTTASTGAMAGLSDSFYVGGVANDDGNPAMFTVNASWTTPTNGQETNGAAHIASAIAYRDAPGSGTQTASWTVNNSNWVSAGIAYKTAAHAYSDHPVDTETARYWDDPATAYAGIAPSAAESATWQVADKLMRWPNLKFDGSNDYYTMTRDDETGFMVLSQVATASAFTVLGAIRVAAVASDEAASYSNVAIVCDATNYMGVHLRNTASSYTIKFFVWDGAEKVISLPISLDTDYVFMFRHEAGNIYASLNGGSETSTACGNITNLTGTMQIGKNFAYFYEGRLGYLRMYNGALTGTDLSDALDVVTTKWLATSASVVPIISTQFRHRR